MPRRAGPTIRSLKLQLFKKCVVETNLSMGNQQTHIYSQTRVNQLLQPSSYFPIRTSGYVGILFEFSPKTRIRTFAKREGNMDFEQEEHKTIVRILYRLMNKGKNLTLRKPHVALISLDIQKLFDYVWVKGLLWKLNNIGVSCNLLS